MEEGDMGFSDDPRRLLYWASGLSIGAALVHQMVTPEHFEAWWGYGLFFACAALAQLTYGALLLLQPWRYDETGGLRADGGTRNARRIAFLGIAGNAAIIGLYIITRTVGIPFFGPEAGEVEPVTPISVLSKFIELALIGCLVAFIRRTAASAPV